jgi:hypothetical protein
MKKEVRAAVQNRSGLKVFYKDGTTAVHGNLHRCRGCRKPYEHTHPWARALRLCKACADAVMVSQSKHQ